MKYSVKVFKEWKSLVDKVSDHQLKILWTVNGGEFCSTEFEGIEHEYNIPKTPEQDGIAECFNRTLVEVVRGICLLILSHRFWAEALSTAAYLINRSPTKALSDMTPFESWFGKN